MSRSKRCMTSYLPDGTTVMVPYVADLMAFVHEGMQIRNPFQSGCGRFYVDPKQYGFKDYHTGGGCMALTLDLKDGDYLLLTNDDGSDKPDLIDPATALLGRYNKDGDPIAIITVGDIPFDSEDIL